MLLGCIGDDFTGSSDLANTLARGGMRVVQYNGVPSTDAAPEVEAGVVALKTRTAPVREAVGICCKLFGNSVQRTPPARSGGARCSKAAISIAR